MKFIKTISLITLFSTSSLFSFNWPAPVYSLFFSLAKTFAWIADYCIPANHEEFCQVKEEIKQMLEVHKNDTEQRMRKKNKIWYLKVKKEFDQKITLNVQACSQKSLALKKQIEEVQTRVLKIIETHHNQHTQNLKSQLLNHSNHVEASITNILTALNKIQKERDLLLQSHHSNVLTLIRNLQSTIEHKYNESKKNIDSNYAQLRTNLIKRHEQRTQKINEAAQLWQDSSNLTSIKTESLKKLCINLTMALTLEREKNKELTQQLHCLKMAHAESAQQSIQLAFGYKIPHAANL